MSPRIFVSCVSPEFRSSRDELARHLSRQGYIAVTQEIFGTEEGDLREVLKRKIDSCIGVMQIVGTSFGAEPPQPDPHWGAVSYTQFELFYAHSRKMKVWVFRASDSFPRTNPVELLDLPKEGDPSDPETYQAERFARQEAYVAQVSQSGLLRHTVTSPEALELAIEKMKDELRAIRKSQERWKTWLVASIAVIAIATGGGFAYQANESKKEREKTEAAAREAKVRNEEIRKQVQDQKILQEIAGVSEIMGEDSILQQVFRIHSDALNKECPPALAALLEAAGRRDSDLKEALAKIEGITRAEKKEDACAFHVRFALVGLAFARKQYDEAATFFKEARLKLASQEREAKPEFHKAEFEFRFFFRGPQQISDKSPQAAIATFDSARVNCDEMIVLLGNEEDRERWRLNKTLCLMEQARAELAVQDGPAALGKLHESLDELGELAKSKPEAGHLSWYESIACRRLSEHAERQKDFDNELKYRSREIEELDAAITSSRSGDASMDWEIARWQAKIRVMALCELGADLLIKDLAGAEAGLVSLVSPEPMPERPEKEQSWRDQLREESDPLVNDIAAKEAEVGGNLGKWAELVEILDRQSKAIMAAAETNPRAANLRLEADNLKQSLAIATTRFDARKSSLKAVRDKLNELISGKPKEAVPKLELEKIVECLRHLDVPNIDGAKACREGLDGYAKEPGADDVREKKLAGELSILITSLFKTEAGLVQGLADQKNSDVRIAILLQRALDYEKPNTFGKTRPETARQCREEAAKLKIKEDLNVKRRTEALVSAIQRTAELIRVHHEAGNDEVTIAMGGLVYAICGRSEVTLDVKMPVTQEWVESRKSENSEAEK